MTADNPPRNDNANYYAVDFALSYETVTASASGTVRFAGEDIGDGYGLKVEIDHPGTGSYFTMYAHLLSKVVNLGDPVSQGQVIGTSGKSGGNNYEPHLHFQLQSGVSAAIPEPMSGLSPGFGQYCLAVSPFWVSKPPWQPEFSWQDWGPVWAASGSDLATAVSHDNSLTLHTVATRVNSIGQKMELQEYTGVAPSYWTGWTNISAASGAGSAFNGKIAVSNHENQLHVIGVNNGDMQYRSRVSGSWSNWTSLGHPTSGALSGPFDGPVAVSYSGVRVVVAGMVQGNVWVRLRYSGSWGVWVMATDAAHTLGESLAIVTRPNGMYSIVSFTPSNHIVWMSCSTNFATWTGWAGLGGSLGDSLAVDNSQATNCGSWGVSYPGVHVVGFSNYHTMIRCWEPYCQLYAWEDLGAVFWGPIAISNTGGVVSSVYRTTNEMAHRWRAY